MGCADTETARTCPHISVRYALIAAYLYADSELSGTRAKAFVPRIPSDTRPARGRPPTGSFGDLEHEGRLDEAGDYEHLANCLARIKVRKANPPRPHPPSRATIVTDGQVSCERSGIPRRCDEMLTNMLDNIIDVGPGRGTVADMEMTRAHSLAVQPEYTDGVGNYVS